MWECSEGDTSLGEDPMVPPQEYLLSVALSWHCPALTSIITSNLPNHVR